MVHRTIHKLAESRLVETLNWTKLWLTNNSALYRMFTTAVQQNPLLKNFAVRAHLLVPNLEGMAKNTYSPEVVERSADRLAEITSRYRHAVILIIPSRALWRVTIVPLKTVCIASLSQLSLPAISMSATCEKLSRREEIRCPIISATTDTGIQKAINWQPKCLSHKKRMLANEKYVADKRLEITGIVSGRLDGLFCPPIHYARHIETSWP